MKFFLEMIGRAAGSYYLYIAFFLFCFAYILFPEFLIKNLHSSEFYKRFIFFILFLVFIILRFNAIYTHSIVYVFSVTSIFLYFIYTLEKSYQDKNFYDFLIDKILLVFKFIILIGIFQSAVFLLKNGLSIKALIIYRPAKSILYHTNGHALATLPLAVYFFIKKDYKWSILAFISYIGTGTKSPLLMLICCSLILYRIILKKEVKYRHIIFSICLMLIFLTYLIVLSTKYIHLNLNAILLNENRMSLGSFIWRVQVWKELILELVSNPKAFLFGNGIASADTTVFYFFNRELNLHYLNERYISPHNDYVRFFYDIGIIGLFLYIMVIASIIKMILKSKKIEILLIFLIMIGTQLSETLFFHDIFIFHFILFGLEIGQGLRNIKNQKLNPHLIEK